MTLRAYAMFLREHWELIASITLAGVIAAMGLVLITPQKFAATSGLFLSTPGYASLGSLAETEASPYRADTFSQERARTYVRLATREDLARRVVDRLELPITPEELVAATSASAMPDTVLIDVTVEADSPAQAKILANAVAAELANDIRTLELPGGVLIPNVDPVLTQPAEEPQRPSSPNIGVYLVVGLTLGFLAGVTFAASRVRARTVHGATAVERITERPVIGTLGSQGTDQAVGPSARGVSARVVAVVSAVPGTAVPSAAAALVASKLCGNRARAMLVEMAESSGEDALEPRFLDGRLGEVLSGEVPLAEAIRHSDDGFLHHLAGRGPTNWCPLLRSERFRDLIGELRDSYDLVLLQHPDFLMPAVATALNDVIDGVVLITPDGRLDKGDLDKVVRFLNYWNVELIGTVLLSLTGSERKEPLEATATREIGV